MGKSRQASDVAWQTKFRNKIINGGMDIWQRATTSPASAGTGFIADRWQIAIAGVFTGTYARDTDTPSGIGYSLGLTVVTADTSVAAGDYVIFRQGIEGYNVQDLLLGTASAEDFTLSFDVKSPVTGTHCVAFRNAASNRSYVAEYTVNVADTWESKTITVSGDTAGTWAVDNTKGLELVFTLIGGSTFQTTAGAWSAGNYLSTSNQVNVVGTSSDKFLLDNVKLEKGSVATDFEQRSIAEEMTLCQRYYLRVYGAANFPSIPGQGFNATLGGLFWEFPTEMRAAPTIGNNLTAVSGIMTATGGLSVFSSMSTINSNSSRAFLRVVTTGGMAAGNASGGLFSSGEYIDADAEL